jgi:hypothetical protein
MEQKIKKQIKERKIEKEILGVLIFLGVLIGVFVIASSYFKSLNYFEHDGLTFSKKRVGNIEVFHHNYYLKVADKLINYNFYIHGDPRYNEIAIDGDRSRLLAPGAVVYVTVNSDGLQQCRSAPLAVGSLSSFLSDNQMKVIGGNLNFWDVPIKNDKWITCENKPGNRVVEIFEGNETKVTIKGNCYRVSVNNCEILEATEKLEVQTLVDAKKSRG